MTHLPLSLDQPLRFDQPLDVDDARRAVKMCAEQRRDARDWKRRALLDAAEKERIYRKARATAWTSAAEGSAKQREDWVNDHTADARFDRDTAAAMVKVCDERLAECDAERASLHRIIEMSMPNVAAVAEPRAQRPFGAAA